MTSDARRLVDYESVAHDLLPPSRGVTLRAQTPSRRVCIGRLAMGCPPDTRGSDLVGPLPGMLYEVHRYLVDPVENLTERVLTEHEIDEGSLHDTYDREPTILR